jgi:hypothetical protein
MPSLSPPLLQAALSALPADVARVLHPAMGQLDKHQRDVSQALSSALVVNDTLQVWQPYTQKAPLVVPSFWKQPAALLNGWANTVGQAPVQYGIDSTGTVFIEGNVSGGVINNTIFTLPYGYCPANNLQFASTGNNAFALLNVGNSGDVLIQTGAGPFCLLTCCFKADATNMSPGIPSCFPFDLPWKFPYAPTWVGVSAGDVSTAAFPSALGSLGVDWVMVVKGGARFLRVRNILGLLQSTSYSITVVAF